MGLTQTPAEVLTKKPWPGRVFQYIIGAVRFLLLGVLGAILLAVSTSSLPFMHYKPAADDTVELAGSTIVLGVMIIVLALYLTITIHELGHFAASMWVGFRFVLMILGPLLIRREAHGLRFRSQVAFLEGLIVSVPTDDHHLRRRLSLVIAGGPLANLGQALVILLLYIILQDGKISFYWSGYVLRCLWFFSVISLINIAPIGVYGGIMTDGAVLLTLAKGGPKAERLILISHRLGASVSGQRPRDLNPIRLPRALAIADGSPQEAHLNLSAYFQTLDDGEIEKAALYLDRALSPGAVIPPLMRAQYFLEAAYFEARYGQNAVTARDWLNLVKRGLFVEKHQRLRAEAAVLLIEGRREEATARANQGLALLNHTIEPGRAKAEAEWLQEIISLSQPSRSDLSEKDIL